VIYPSPEISHWNRLMAATLEFWKMKRKTCEVLDEPKQDWTVWYKLGELKNMYLYLLPEFYNIIFKIKRKLYTVSRSPLQNAVKNSGCTAGSGWCHQTESWRQPPPVHDCRKLNCSLWRGVAVFIAFVLKTSQALQKLFW